MAFWAMDLLGHFSVRSAYFVARDLLGKEVLRAELRSPIWKLLWSAAIMPKVKFFIWRLLWAILPTTDSLASRDIQMDNRCRLYGVGPGSHCTCFLCMYLMQESMAASWRLGS